MVDRIIEYISIFLALMVVLPLHEFAHGFAAVKSGDMTPRLYRRYTLNPLAHFDPIGLLCFVFAGFGWAKPMPVNPNNFKNYKWGCFWVSISGVLTNFLTAFIVFPIFILSARIPEFGYFITVLRRALSYVYSMSLTFCVFNLIPVYPLDGFRVVEVFNKKRGSVFRFLREKGIFVLYGLFALSIFADITGIWQLDILGIFIRFFANYLGKPIFWFWGLIFNG